MKDIKGYEGLYAITEEGQVWSYRAQKFLLPFTSTNGYLIVVLSLNGEQKHFRIHRLVAEAYIPNPLNKPEVNHLDENKTNNHVSNLEWATTKENIQHSARKGVRKNFSKIRCVETGAVYKSCSAAARAVNLHPYSINSVVNGKQKTAGGYHWERVIEEDK